MTKLAARRWPIGTPVAVHPGDGHLPEAHWHGVICGHEDLDVGLVEVECTDPHRFLNKWPGLEVTVPVVTLRRTGEAQPTLFDSPA